MSAAEGMNPAEAAQFVQRQDDNLRHLGNISLQVVVELGRKRMLLHEALALDPDDVITLDKLAGEPHQVRVNDHQFAQAEIVVVTDLTACRLTHIHRPESPELTFSTPGLASVVGGAQELVEDEEAEGHKRGMILIPAGPFTMGSPADQGPQNERPAHRVHLDAYYIDPFPVTNEQYYEFVQETGHRVPVHWSRDVPPSGDGAHPVTNVSWSDAQAYAKWTDARLPSEAEWEKAARGTDDRRFPWGDRFVEGERCNSSNMVGTTTPVDEFPDGRSAYGVWDMAGNVFEWCEDFYDELYYERSPPGNPAGPPGGRERVVRGGSYQETRAILRCTSRIGEGEGTSRDNVGFRLAMDV